MINLAVIPGNTIFVKSQLVEAFSEQILAVLADDDSILIVARTAEAAEIVEQVKNGRSVCYRNFDKNFCHY